MAKGLGDFASATRIAASGSPEFGQAIIKADQDDRLRQERRRKKRRRHKKNVSDQKFVISTIMQKSVLNPGNINPDNLPPDEARAQHKLNFITADELHPKLRSAFGLEEGDTRAFFDRPALQDASTTMTKNQRKILQQFTQIQLMPKVRKRRKK